MGKHIYNLGRPMTNTKQVFLNFKDNLLAMGESKEYVILIGLGEDYRPKFDYVEKISEEKRESHKPDKFFRILSANECKRCVLVFSHKSNRLKANTNDRKFMRNINNLAEQYGVKIIDNIIIKSDLTSYSAVL